MNRPDGPATLSHTASSARRIDSLCDEFERAVRSGAEVSLADVLLSVAEPSRTELLQQLLLVEWEYRSEQGERIDPAREFARFPSDVTTVREAFEEHERDHRENGQTARLADTLPAWQAWQQTGYEILGRLGSGGMSTVLLAYETERSRLVALKTLLPGTEGLPDHLGRFRREAETLAKLDHPNIVRIYEVGSNHGIPFYTMEYCPRGSLADFLRTSRLTQDEAAAVVECLARAVDAAHQRDVIHCDLKPSNILLEERELESSEVLGRSPTDHPSSVSWGELPFLRQFVPKVSDFGIVKSLDSSLRTQTGALLGTPQYMAPEQARGGREDIERTTDVHGLGVLLYVCLTGRPPFQSESLVTTLQHVIRDPALPPSRLLPDLSPDLETICLKCLRKCPSTRYRSAADIADDLGCYLDRKPIVGTRPHLIEKFGEWVRRSPVVATLMGVLLVAGITGLALAAWALQERDAAIAARLAADNSRAEAVESAGLAHREAADSMYHRALAICAHQGAEVGLHWLARSLDAAVAIGDEQLEETIRLQLGAYRMSLWELKHALPHDHIVYKCVFSPDGELVATSSGDGTAKLWHVATGLPFGEPLVHPGRVFQAAFSPDGSQLLTGCEDGGVRLWDIAGGAILEPILWHDDRVLGVAFHPNGRTILTGSDDRTARLWDLTTGRLLTDPLQHRGTVRSVDFNPDGTVFATGCADGCARVWSSDSRELQLPALQCHKDVFAMEFSPDGRQLLTCNRHTFAQVWDVETGEQVGPRLQHHGGVMGGTFDPTGKVVITTSDDRTARLWSVDSGDALGRIPHATYVRGVDISPDGQTIATACFDRAARLWESGLPTRLHNGRIPVRAARFDPSDDAVVTCTATTLTRWDAVTGNEIGPAREHGSSKSSAAFSPDGRTLLAVTNGGTGDLIDVETGMLRATMHQDGGISEPRFSPDGRRLITRCSVDSAVRIWDSTTGNLMATLAQESDRASCVLFGPDSQTVVIAISDGTVAFVDASSGEFPGGLLAHPKAVIAAEFSPDGQILACGGLFDEVFLWNPQTRRQIRAPLQQSGYVRALAFSPDGRVLVTASGDYTVRLWEVATGRQLGTSLRQSSRIESIVFSPDGRRFLVRCNDLSVRVWPFYGRIAGTPDEVARWCERITGATINSDHTIDQTTLQK